MAFSAVSNRTYTVEYRDDIGAAGWSRLADVAAATTNRTVVLVDAVGEGTRFYRLRTPRRP